jgi:HSP20 family protein
MPDQPSSMSEQNSDQTTGQESAEQQSARGSQALPTLIPPTDIYETKDEIILLMDVPGADPGGVDVTLDKRRLTVTARMMESPPPEGYTLIYAEYQQGNYERGFTLVGDIDGDRIDAMLKDGVLRLKLPKVTPSPAKKIPVRAS